MQKTVIFDLNGVFIHAEFFSERIKRKYGVPVDEFLPVLNEIMSSVQQPNAEEVFEYWKPHLKQWNIDIEKDDFYTFWFGAEKEDAEMVAYARQLKQNGWQLFILSNNFKERTDYYWKTFPFLKELFVDVLFSWETGVLKPDAQSFTNILEQYGLRPKDCYYFDDNKTNVATAKQLGIDAFVYENVEQVRSILSNVDD